jgi:hypothetical protein
MKRLTKISFKIKQFSFSNNKIKWTHIQILIQSKYDLLQS